MKLECVECKTKAQLALKRCKHFELGGEKSKRVKLYNSKLVGYRKYYFYIINFITTTIIKLKERKEGKLIFRLL